MVRSVAVTLWRGGVRWRETFYPLRELKPWNGAFAWELDAAKERAARRKAERIAGGGRWVRAAERVRSMGRKVRR
jgi:hypothetical protein